MLLLEVVTRGFATTEASHRCRRCEFDSRSSRMRNRCCENLLTLVGFRIPVDLSSPGKEEFRILIKKLLAPFLDLSFSQLFNARNILDSCPVKINKTGLQIGGIF